MRPPHYRDVASFLRDALDPRSRRPLVVLAALVFLALFAPLLRDLYFVIPWHTRWWFGEVLLGTLLGLALLRLMTRNEGDAWPVADHLPALKACHLSARWLPWVLRLGTFSLALPLVVQADGLGFADWDFFLEKFEAARLAIANWQQIPWWDPWTRGGFPLGGEPQVGVFSPAMPLVLLLGTPRGLGLASVLCIGLAVEGTYRLAWHWFREPWAASAAALIYGLNGAVSVDTAWGYFIPMSYAAIPWAAYCAFRIGDGLGFALGLGLTFGLSLLMGLQYLSLYAGILAVAVWIRAVRVAAPRDRGRILVHTVAAAGLLLVLTGWRLAAVLDVLHDDLRLPQPPLELTVVGLFRALWMRPSPLWPEQIPVKGLAAFIETTCYVGPLALVLVALSLRGGWRWWHTLALVACWFALGRSGILHPSYWTSSWPLLRSTHVVSRWRFMALLGLALAAASSVAQLRLSARSRSRVMAAAVVVVLGVDYLYLAHQQLPLALGVEPRAGDFPAARVVRGIVNLRTGAGYPASPVGLWSDRGL